MLLNDLYTISDTQTSDNKIGCRIVFDAEHAIFGGHFPGQPIVPGVCMMEMVKELVQQQTGKQFVLRTAGNVKFLRLITPDIQPIASISWQQNGDSYKVNASFSGDTAVLFKLDGHYDTVVA